MPFSSFWAAHGLSQSVKVFATKVNVLFSSLVLFLKLCSVRSEMQCPFQLQAPQSACGVWTQMLCTFARGAAVSWTPAGRWAFAEVRKVLLSHKYLVLGI